MPNITYANDHRQFDAKLPPQLAQFGPAVETVLRELFVGDQPLVPGHRKRAFIIAALDEIGRGTHPSKLKQRLLASFEESSGVIRAA